MKARGAVCQTTKPSIVATGKRAKAATMVSPINPLVAASDFGLLLLLSLYGARASTDRAMALIRWHPSGLMTATTKRVIASARSPGSPLVMHWPHLAEPVLDFCLQTIYQRSLKSKLLP